MSTNSYKNLGLLLTKDWREGLEVIRAQRAELAQYAGIMTAYELSVAQREIQSTIERWKPEVVTNLLREHQAAIDSVKAARANIEKQRAVEVNRWDAGKLGQELQVAKMLLEQAGNAPAQGDPFRGGSKSKTERITQLYQDAKQSGDMFKARARAQVLQGLEVGGDFELNHLKKQAERDLAALRRTAEIDQALMDVTLLCDVELPEDEMLESVEKARARLAPLLACSNGPSMPNLHAFGHAHIDIAWLWPLAETERKIARTLANRWVPDGIRSARSRWFCGTATFE